MEKKMNLPNKLTVMRIILVPVFMFFIIVPVFPNDTWSRIIAAAVFLFASITDFFDGIIARRRNLITDFGKFLDPLADKFLVIGALIAITASYGEMRYFSVWVTTVVFFREMAVTSLRLVVNTDDGVVVAANFIAKCKTMSQCICIMTILLEPLVITNHLNTQPYLFSYITMGIMLVLTVYSGYVYFKSYWKYIDPMK